MSNRTETVPGHPEGLPPEASNSEQELPGKQAQDVAEDARNSASHTSSPTESEKVESGGYEVAPSSKADLVDEMRRMEGEGRIDMSAFAGEPNHDDETDAFGGETTDDDADDYLIASGEELVEKDSDA